MWIRMLQRYIVDLVTKIRQHRQVVIGSSPRGSLALMKLSRAWAAIQGGTMCYRMI